MCVHKCIHTYTHVHIPILVIILIVTTTTTTTTTTPLHSVLNTVSLFVSTLPLAWEATSPSARASPRSWCARRAGDSHYYYYYYYYY